MKPTPLPRHISLVATVLVVLVTVGCAAAPMASSPPPTVDTSPPAPPSFGPEAVTMANLGFVNGPADRVALPADIEVDELIDQPNVVTVIVSAPSGPELIAFLGERLPSGGFEISAIGENGIVFTGYGWDGAATAGEPSGVTLRRQN